MRLVRPQPLPPHSLLIRYAGGYADCLVADVPAAVSHAEFVEAFYCSWLFRLERLVLTLLVFKPSSDDEARALARGERDHFAAWSVEARAPNQLLVCDFQGKTRSWLMVEPCGESGAGTRLFFGTGIIPVRDRQAGTRRMSFFFRALLPFHRVYARALLRAARARLTSRGR